MKLVFFICRVLACRIGYTNFNPYQKEKKAWRKEEKETYMYITK